MTQAIFGHRKYRDLVENRNAISIFELKARGALKDHPFDDYPCSSNGILLYWKRGNEARDYYIELRNRGPKNRQSTFNLITTTCHYGSKRYWLECPQCHRRAAKLYEKDDNFSCRKCLMLEYFSHLMNYRSIEPTVRRLIKLKELQEKNKFNEHLSYRGKLTKRAVRMEKLRWQVDMGTDYYLPKLNGSKNYS